MRSVVLMMSVSVDGFVAGPHGHAGALPEPDELKRWKLDRVRRAGTHIMGRVTYEGVRERPADVPGPARRAAARTDQGTNIRHRYRPPCLQAKRSMS
jgi:dihydrofolate reductase